MKVPSIFRIPRHQRFQYIPRYYDEVKEDLEKRTARIRREVEREGETERSTDHRSRISGGFSRYHESRRQDRNTSLMQLIMVLVLFGAFTGYLFYGSIVLYALLLIFPVYIYFKVKRII